MTEDDILYLLLNDHLILHLATWQVVKFRAAGDVIAPPTWGNTEEAKLVAAVNELTPKRASFLLAKVMVQTP